MPAKIANRNCGTSVAAQIAFTGSNLWGETREGLYVVFSYGGHWPLLVNKDGVWYQNSDKYSASTSRHLSQARRSLTDCQQLSVLGMQQLLR
jgi:hypothetical protein